MVALVTVRAPERGYGFADGGDLRGGFRLGKHDRSGADFLQKSDVVVRRV